MRPGLIRAERPGIQIGLTLCLGIALLALSYVRIIGDSGSAAFGDKITDAALAGPVWGTALGNHLIAFALAQVILHVGFALLCLMLARCSRIAWPASKHSVVTWLLLWFTVGAGWLLVANAAHFPASSLGRPYAESVRTSWHGLSVFSSYSAALATAIAWNIGNALLRARRPLPTRLPRWALPVCVTAIVVAVIAARAPVAASPAIQDKPHIILIGLDSLRFDAVQASTNSLTPAIDKFLNGAVNFTDATTPLARTFPAWVSIITGRHPHTTGAVINLLPRDLIQTGDTLPTLLSALGYQSTYAIDEVRFSNLDRSYGFQKMIAPPIGATDFMLGFFADTPLSNLIVNTRLGALLFPYTYANRAAATTYDPSSFIDRLDRELDFAQPTLLAAHFTLAHWPYTWADAKVQAEGASINAHEVYDAAVARLDQQFADFMTLLEKHHALDNALVVVLSDHGESLGSLHPGEVQTREPGFPEYEEANLMGHGTSVFSSHQYHVVLAMRSYGKTPFAAGASRTIDAAVSLEDLTPTIAAALGASPAEPFEGKSLLPLLDLQSAAAAGLDDRIRFTETEFNPPGFMPGQIPSASAFARAASYYRVDPVTDRVLVRRERLKDVLVNRQYAAFRNGKLLALVPTLAGSQAEHQVLLAAHEGQAPVSIANPAAHSDPDVVGLWAALSSRFPRLVDESGGAR